MFSRVDETAPAALSYDRPTRVEPRAPSSEFQTFSVMSPRQQAMINFIWSPGNRLPAGTGGSENYTVGQVRELTRRGMAAQVITIGLGKDDGRIEFGDIPFKALASLEDIAELTGTVIFVNEPHVVETSEMAFIILHNPPPLREKWRAFATIGTAERGLIATSKYAASLWAEYLPISRDAIQVAYPFAEPCFALETRVPNGEDTMRVLFAGRLSPEKGIYTLLEMLHVDTIVENRQLTFTVTTAGSDKPQGQIIETLVNSHPNIQVIGARKTPKAMAGLMAAHDIVVMPSNSQYWHETFGIVSVEAQHSGCWVVASDDGGLPETDCGGLILVKPDDPEALANGIGQALAMGPRSQRERSESSLLFTVGQSVDNLLDVLYAPVSGHLAMHGD
jgi:D-inositol-3-phosphate glycosyltransferase